MDSFSLDFNSFRSSFWDSAKRPFISIVISSFKEVLSPSNTLFTILEDLPEGDPATEASWSLNSTFSTKIGELTISVTFLEVSYELFLLFWLLVDIFMTRFDLPT